MEGLWATLADGYEALGRREEAYLALGRARRAREDLPLLQRQAALAGELGRGVEQLDLEEELATLMVEARPLEAAMRFRSLGRRALDVVRDPVRAARLLELAEGLAPARPEDRRLLADVQRTQPATVGAARARYLDLVREIWPPDPALLLALGETAASMGDEDLARTALDLAAAMAGEPPTPPPSLRTLPEGVWSSPPFPTNDPLVSILGSIGPILEALFPLRLQRHGVSFGDRVGPGQAPQLRHTVDELVSALRASPVDVYLVPGMQGITVETTRPPSLLLGGGTLATSPPGAIGFLVAQRISMLQLGLGLPIKFSARDTATLAALVVTFLAGVEAVPAAERQRLRPFLQALETACPAGLRRSLAEPAQRLAAELSGFDPTGWLEGELARAGRIALWVTGDLGGALAALAFDRVAGVGDPAAPAWDSSRGRALIAWAFSAERLALRGER